MMRWLQIKKGWMDNNDRMHCPRHKVHARFQANDTVNGVKFKWSREGNLCSTPLEARESVAAQMLNN